MQRECRGGVVKLIRKLIKETMSSIEMLEQPFSERIKELLGPRKAIVVCEASVKNVVMGVHWAMMTREKEELTSHEIHAKDWNFNTSKTAETVTQLDLITTLKKITQH